MDRVWPDDASAQVQIGVVGGDITTVTDPTGSPDPTRVLGDADFDVDVERQKVAFLVGEAPG